jgi:AGCS family alanine or glycine:cation symporter
MQILLKIESLVSGMLPLTLLLAVGIYLSVKTRCFQFRKFFKAIKFSLFCQEKDENGVTSFGAMCNSLAATVGTGNIAGVAAAISIGGAGAVFWMWITALVSMVVKASEIVIALYYRKTDGETKVGGPMYYIKYGLGEKYGVLAVVFAISGVFSAFTTGNITQINSCISVISQNFYIKLIVGIILCLVVGAVIVGGVQKITKFTTVLLPLMAVGYILLCIVVIVKNYNQLGNAFSDIFKGAFAPKAVTGGVIGSIYRTVISGAQKGIFSNEAGLGTAAMAHSTADNANLKTQGLFGVFEVFADTLLICTLTALTILCSGVIIDYNKVASSELVAKALSRVYGGVSLPLLATMLLLFGVASVIGWAAYGIDCSKFLFGKKGAKVFVFIYPLFCIIGAIVKVEFAWRTAEFFNGIMLIINLFAVFMLSHKAIKVLGE